MSHPTDRLAELVDGTLPDAERRTVLDHVHGCASCTAEVETASAARRALRSLPSPAIPPGLGAAAIEQAQRDAAGRAPEVRAMRPAGAAPAWSRIAAGIGAAAVIVIAIAVAAPNLGGDPTSNVRDTAADVEVTQGPLTLEVLDTDFDFESVRTLADVPLSMEATAAPGGAAPAMDAATSGALDCLTEAFETLPGKPARVIEARFDGRPAYLAVVPEGPGAGQAADTVYVLVADRRDCRVVSSSRFELPSTDPE